MGVYEQFYDFFIEVAFQVNNLLDVSILPGLSFGLIAFIFIFILLVSKLGDIFLW